ncbi:hypothetical protein MRX96_051447 [Rhipicephalus microplus]
MKRPASNLDKLEELEDALNGNAVAPCVPTESALLRRLTNIQQPTRLGEKLHAALVTRWDKLVKDNVSSCINCTTKAGGVCYLPRLPPYLPVLVYVTAIDENFVTVSVSMHIRKTFPLKDAFRAFLQRVREADLLSSSQCKSKEICTRFSSAEIASSTEKPLFELCGFLVFYAALHFATV